MIKWEYFNPSDLGVWLFPIIALILLIAAFCQHVRREKKDRNMLLVISILCVALSFTTIMFQCEHDYCEHVYVHAVDREDAGDYELAYAMYQDILGFRDTNNRVEALFPVMTYDRGTRYIRDGMWKAAADEFVQIPGYLDSDNLWEECIYFYLEEKHPAWK